MSAIRRSVALLTVGGALGVGLATDLTVTTESNSSRALRGVVAVAPVSLSGTQPRASAWFCAAGTAEADSAAPLTVRITNVSRAPASVRVRVASVRPEVERAVEVAPGTSVSIPVVDLVPTATPAVIVEVSSGRVVVDQSLAGANDGAWSMCATRPSGSWYLAGGTAAINTVSRLALFNPFSEAAIVRVQFQTDIGIREPFDLQALVIPARTRIDVNVDEVLGNPTLAAAIVEARVGRVIAQRFEVTNDTSVGSGIALGNGSPGLSRRLVTAFPARMSTDRVVLSLTNPGERATTAEISIRQSGDVSSTRKERIAAGHSIFVELSSSITADAPALIEVSAGEMLAGEVRWWQTSDGTTVIPGVASIGMSQVLSEEWFVPIATGGAVPNVTIGNPSENDAAVTVRTVSATGEAQLERLTIPSHGIAQATAQAVAEDVVALRIQSSEQVTVTVARRIASAEGVIGDLSADTGVPVQ